MHVYNFISSCIHVFNSHHLDHKTQTKDKTTAFIQALTDIGSSNNVIEEQTYDNMSTKPKPLRTDTKVRSYGTGNKVTLLAMFQDVQSRRNTNMTQRQFLMQKTRFEIF